LYRENRVSIFIPHYSVKGMWENKSDVCSQLGFVEEQECSLSG
jgi:hypothetical protein